MFQRILKQYIMTEFANHSGIFLAITYVTCPMPGLIKDLLTIEKVFESMGGYKDLGLLIETTDNS